MGEVESLLYKIRARFDSEKGSALVAALAVLLILDLFAVAVLALTTSQMSITARDRQSVKALNVAEAGLNRAIWRINNDHDQTYAPTAENPDSGTMSSGQGEFRIELSGVAGQPDQRLVTVTSAVPNFSTSNAVKKKIIAKVEVCPRVFSYGMYAFSWIDIRGATALTYLAPIDYLGPNARGGDMGSNFTIYFNDAGIKLNYRGEKPGEQQTFDALFGNPPVEMGNIVTCGPGSSVWAVNGYVSTIDELQAKCSRVNMKSITHLTTSVTFPTLNFEGPPNGDYDKSFKYMAEQNSSNGEHNSIAGNGIYTEAEFAQLLNDHANLTLTGVIFVHEGEVEIPNNCSLTIENGGLIIEDDPDDPKAALTVANRGSLCITHTTTESHTLPGLIVFSGEGYTADVIDRGTMEIEGLVYSERTYSEQQSATRIRGVLLASGTQSNASIINYNSSIIIQYDPSVTDMSGITNYGDLFVKRIVSWREVTP